MKRTTLILLILLLGTTAFGEVIGVLPGILKPDSMTVFKERLYCMEGHNIYIYSLKNLKLIKKIGKTGEGPGEFNADTEGVEFTIFSNKIVVRDQNKVVYFSLEGKYLKEKKFHRPPYGLIPVKNSFIGVEHLNKTIKNGSYFISFSLVDQEMKVKESIFKQKFTIFVEKKMNVIADSINYSVYKDKIFVERSPEGFIIDVYNTEGKLLYSIKKDFEITRITQSFIEDFKKRYQRDPVIKMLGINDFTKRLHFSKYFPLIKDIHVSEDKLYIKTFKTENKKEEYIIMDLKGKILKSLFLPATIQPKLLELMKGNSGNCYYFKDNKFHYLKENENEEWELRTEAL